jgi:hypothetical protein
MAIAAQMRVTKMLVARIINIQKGSSNYPKKQWRFHVEPRRFPFTNRRKV